MLFWPLNKIITLVRQSLVLSTLLFLSILIGVFLYSLFYNWYLPTGKISRYIDFGVYTGQTKNYELIGEVNVFDRPTDTLHYGQEYSISLVIDLPESDLNFDLGMFGVTVDVVDIDGRKSASFKTMGTLVYKSFLLRCMTTLFYFPYYIFGRFEQRQTVNLVIKDNFIDNAYMPAYKLIVKIHGRLQFYTAVLKVDAKFTGLKYMLNNWFYLSFVVGTTWLTLIVFLIILTSFYDLKSLFFTDNNKRKKAENKPRKSSSDMALCGKLSDDIKPTFLTTTTKEDIHLRFKENLITFKEYLKLNKQSID